MREKAAPISVWIAASAIILLFAGFVSKLYFYSVDKKYQYFNTERLDTWKTKPGNPDTIRVVLIGTSASYCAYPFDDSLNILNNRPYGKEIDFIRITMTGGILSDFEPIFNDILEAKPDMLLIESTIMLMRLFPERPFHHNIRGEIKDWFQDQFGDPELVPWYKASPNYEQFYEMMPEIREFVKNSFIEDTARWHRDMNEWQIYPKDKLRQYDPFLRNLQNAGIPLAMIDLGRRTATNEYLLRHYGDQISSIQDHLVQNYNILSFSADTCLEDDHYSDHAHIKEEANAIACEWLIGIIHKISGDELY